MKQLYRLLGILNLLLVAYFNQLEANEQEHSIAYRVVRSDYTLSTAFDMASDRNSVGRVTKSIFNIATHYDAYDRFGLYEGQGICRILCMGLFYTKMTEIDVYNAEGDKIGMIDGQISSTAKFSFYDALNQKVAIGYLDKNCIGFSLVDPDNSDFVIARLTRNFIQDTVDNWDVVIYQPERISSILVKIFAAFACDTQHKFKPDL